MGLVAGELQLGHAGLYPRRQIGAGLDTHQLQRGRGGCNGRRSVNGRNRAAHGDHTGRGGDDDSKAALC